MTDWNGLGEVKSGTWGAFVKYALGCGVSVQILPEVPYADGVVEAIEFLHRADGEEALTYPMPRQCTPDRKLGFGRLANICSRLRIKEPKWPIDY